MIDTAEALTGEQRSRLASGFGANRKPTPPWDFATLEGAGALRSTADDLLRFARANFSEGDTGGNGDIVAACRSSQRARAGRLGLFWNRTKLSRSNAEAVWHNGGTGGTHSMLVVVPGRNIAVVALYGCVDSAAAVDALGLTLADRLARPTPPPPPK